MPKLTKEQVLKKYGVRSGLEADIKQQLEASGIEFEYESVVLRYTRPKAEGLRCTPDFVLTRTGTILEVKGRFLLKDRQKWELVLTQYPMLDIRFIFSNPHAKLPGCTKMTGAMWCEKFGVMWAKGKIPKEWLNE